MQIWQGLPTVDRSAHLRTPEGLAAAAAHPGAAVMVTDQRGAVALAGGTTDDGLAWEPVGATDPQRLLFLGSVGGAPRFARVAAEAEAEAVVPLRDGGFGLSPTDLECAITATALASWHRAETHCSRCGAATAPAAGGFSRACQGCGAEHFPRHDPAMIVGVVDAEDRLLLGHQAAWAPGRYSLLAGFVEAGESVEQAVHREVFEEVGVRLSDVSFLVSQPWPFPRSLMFVFSARALPGEVVPDGNEIVDARFFGRDELTAALESGQLHLPASPISSSAWLIAAWRRGDLPLPPA